EEVSPLLCWFRYASPPLASRATSPPAFAFRNTSPRKNTSRASPASNPKVGDRDAAHPVPQAIKASSSPDQSWASLRKLSSMVLRSALVSFTGRPPGAGYGTPAGGVWPEAPGCVALLCLTQGPASGKT